MTRGMRLSITGIFVLTSAIAFNVAAAQRMQGTVEVFKSPTCGCCSLWVKHLESHGFTVRATNVDDIYDVKAKYRVPAAVESCHTGIVAGYAIEGHVPAADVQRLLKERPAGIVGIGVRGMPIGSPGMEVAGVNPQPYTVLAFDKQGKTRVFATHAR